LLVVGELPEGLRNAGAIAYAQMPRPRAVLAVGAEDVSPLPGPDVSVGLDNDALASGVAELRRIFETGSFSSASADFEAAALSSSTEYTCSMHPEVVQDEPGTCPKCGMDLIPREARENNAEDGHEGHDHDGGAEDSSEGVEEQEDHNAHHGAGDGHGEGNEHSGEDAADEEAESESDESTHGEEHAGHDEMDHGDMDFMSMVEMTQGTPRGSDGLQMEWVESPFGPLFPGLPGGLSLTLTLGGDTVEKAEAGSAVSSPLGDLCGPVGVFCEKLAMMDRLSPISYRLLALRAIEDAADVEVDDSVALARMAVLERERAASHLNWLANFGHLLGYAWLTRQSERLLLSLLQTKDNVDGVRTEMLRLTRRVERTPLLRRKLSGVGVLAESGGAAGPVARASGFATDARLDEETYRSLSFEPIIMESGDALARLRVRLAEVEQSLGLASATDEVAVLSTDFRDEVSGRGAASVETPRGISTLALTLENGEVSAIELDTPSERNFGLVSAVTEQRELADALVGVASLDLSPWGISAGGAG
jgi:Ni,Fe-hydrogenase III large subunit